ncbi:MAG: hypothetical protein PF904_13130 [Kiritimatiellae bacterium]|jgi:hypothetical protein|nr:hypothetical protein [Kiritimatiellia bacterium]
MKKIVWSLVLSLIICMSVFAESSGQGWTVRMSTNQTLLVENANLHVDFAENQAWTIRNIKYMGEEIVGEHGANGTVVNATPGKGMDPNDPWIGTGHGKEVVKSFSVIVDGKPHKFQKGALFFRQGNNGLQGVGDGTVWSCITNHLLAIW